MRAKIALFMVSTKFSHKNIHLQPINPLSQLIFTSKLYSYTVNSPSHYLHRA